MSRGFIPSTVSQTFMLSSCIPHSLRRISEMRLTLHSRHLSTTKLNYAINGCIFQGNLNEARKLFDQNPQNRNVDSWNLILTGYFKNKQVSEAQHLFFQMPEKDIVSWNTMLSVSREAENPEQVYLSFLEMIRVGVRPDEFTLSTIIKSIMGTRFSVLLAQVHGLGICSGLNLSVYVGSALVRGYCKLGNVEGMRRVFDEIVGKDVSSWNALIWGYMELGLSDESQRVFEMMPDRNVVSWTTLVDGFIKNGRLYEARAVFDMMSERNVFSWTAMINGYVRFSKFYDALELFSLMLEVGPSPNHFTFSSVLEACAGSSSLVTGNQVHSCMLKSGIPLNAVLFTNLVHMYAKCGDIEAAHCVFESMPKKNVASWNSVIEGYAKHGTAKRALQEFERMRSVGVKPNRKTFINVLLACVHSGLVEEGERLFADMDVKYGIQAENEHYACMVELYGKAGQLEKAGKLIKEMPFQPNVVVWDALIAACELQLCSELGEFAAKGLDSLEQYYPVVYSLLSKMHADKAVWDGVQRFRKQKPVSRIDLSCAI